MTVAALISKLSEFPSDLEVEITDGYKCYCYSGDYVIQLFSSLGNKDIVDIGIGGLDDSD